VKKVKQTVKDGSAETSAVAGSCHADAPLVRQWLDPKSLWQDIAHYR
jgi:hypothetical protein